MRVVRLVGRDEEVAYLSAALGQNGTVVAGAAGVGKNRLARVVVATLEDHAVFEAAVTAAGRELPLGGIAGLRLLEGEQQMLGRAGLFSGLTAALLEAVLRGFRKFPDAGEAREGRRGCRPGVPASVEGDLLALILAGLSSRPGPEDSCKLVRHARQ